MEKISTAHDDLLLEYLDGKIAESDLLKLKTQLENSPDLKRRLEELRLVHASLLPNQLEIPSVNFTQKVMNNLHRVQLASTLSPKNGLLLIAGMLVAAGILTLVIQAGTFDHLNGIISPESFPAAPVYLQKSVPEFQIRLKPVINIIIGINLVLGFIILDRTVLRPLFRRRAGIQF